MNQGAALRVLIVLSLSIVLSGCLLKAGFDPDKDSRLSLVRRVHHPGIQVYASDTLIRSDDFPKAVAEIGNISREKRRVYNALFDAIKPAFDIPEAAKDRTLSEWMEIFLEGPDELKLRTPLPWPKKDRTEILIGLTRFNDALHREFGTRGDFAALSLLEKAALECGRVDGSRLMTLEGNEKKRFEDICMPHLVALIKFRDVLATSNPELLASVNKLMNAKPQFGLDNLTRYVKVNKGEVALVGDNGASYPLNFSFYNATLSGKQHGIVLSTNGQVGEYFDYGKDQYMVRTRFGRDGSAPCPAGFPSTKCENDTIKSPEALIEALNQPGTVYLYFANAQPSPPLPIYYYPPIQAYTTFEDVIRFGRSSYDRASGTVREAGRTAAEETKKAGRAIREDIKTEARGLLPWFLR